MSAFLTNALDESGVLVHVDNVPKGYKCNCICPRCKEPLYAKNGGTIREHHFAHARGHECEHAYETSLHLLAKEVLSETGFIMLPESPSASFPEGLVQLHNIEIEKKDARYGFIPDVEGVMENGKRLLIEFYVSHKVDDRKREIIIANNLMCIEIDINYMALEKEKLRKFLTETAENRKWITTLPKKKAKKKESYSISTGRNPSHLRIRDNLKELFDKNTLVVDVPNGPYSYTSIHYDLKKLGYDVCEVNTPFHRFESDLLLFRSNKKQKGYISINIRGKRRSTDFRHPEELKIIDIIVTNSNEDFLVQQISKGYTSLNELSGNDNIDYHFYNKHQPNTTETEQFDVNNQDLEYIRNYVIANPDSSEAKKFALSVANSHERH